MACMPSSTAIAGALTASLLLVSDVAPARLACAWGSGVYLLSVTGQDAAGNVAAAPLQANWTVALQPGLSYVWPAQGTLGATAAETISYDLQVCLIAAGHALEPQQQPGSVVLFCLCNGAGLCAAVW